MKKKRSKNRQPNKHIFYIDIRCMCNMYVHIFFYLHANENEGKNKCNALSSVRDNDRPSNTWYI